MDAKNFKPITPRSPRTALEPDMIEAPARRSKSVRNPFVVIGNAIISLFVLAAIVAGIALVSGKQRFEAAGPLPDDKVVNIPRGSGIRDIADVLTREGVIDQSWVFIGGVLLLKAREDLKAGEYQFKAHASLRDVVATIVEGRVVTHQFAVPETFGQDAFNSYAAIPSASFNLSITAMYSFTVCPNTFTITLQLGCRLNGGSFRSMKSSTPTFCSPIAFSIPAAVCTMRGAACPAIGSTEIPLVTIAPSRSSDTISSNSTP